ncbi:MAG: hypothetical protein ABI171_07290 [Collimonas sp.]|uniref:hypothetical protein n=1 Tax=Collimonas sp. TaxID=1963772 RepID=UPI003265BC3B
MSKVKNLARVFNRLSPTLSTEHLICADAAVLAEVLHQRCWRIGDIKQGHGKKYSDQPAVISIARKKEGCYYWKK